MYAACVAVAAPLGHLQAVLASVTIASRGHHPGNIMTSSIWCSLGSVFIPVSLLSLMQGNKAAPAQSLTVPSITYSMHTRTAQSLSVPSHHIKHAHAHRQSVHAGFGHQVGQHVT